MLKNTELIQPIEFEHRNLKEASKALRQEISTQAAAVKIPHSESDLAGLADQPFVHCHAHSQFSILQSTASTQDLIRAAAEDGMPGIALTDMGNMMGAFHFLQQIEQYNKSIAQEGEKKTLKGIVGCELNVCEDHSNKRQKDNGYQIVFLAKNKTGYHNLAKLSSMAYTHGFYYVPRVDRKLIEQHKEGLIVLTGNLYGEVPSKVLNVGTKQAEEALIWWSKEFGQDLYVEIMRHGQEDEDRVNEVLIDLARKHDIRLVAK